MIYVEMKKPKFSLAQMDEELVILVERSDHKILALWAIDCVERIFHFFEKHYPKDLRPRQAIDTLKVWIDTGEFKMQVIRSASLSAHAAARAVGEDNAARSAARAAGQAVATAHVPRHALAAANYALQAIHRAANAEDAKEAVEEERAWQYQHLIDLNRRSNEENHRI